jgi:hypothetical protein
MLRQIWHRAAALALPITLAICLPPLAVIAFNLHAQSAGPVRPVVPAHAAAAKLEKKRASGTPDRRDAGRVAPAAEQNQFGSSRK